MQELFVREYLKDLKGQEAAIRAGYSEKSAKQQAYLMLKEPAIKAAVDKAIQARANRLEITADMVLQELAKIGFASMGNYLRITEDGDPMIDMSDCTPEQLSVLAEATVEDFKEGRGENARDVRKVKIKLHDKLGALTQIGRHLGMFTDKVDHTSGGQPFKALIGVDIEDI
jgi:phage terminase small subunit